MTRIALIDPVGLVADELRSVLGRHHELWTEIRLLTSQQQLVGTLSEVAGAAAMVTALEDDDLDLLDVACLCGSWAQSQVALERLPSSLRTIALSPDAPPGAGRSIGAGIALEILEGETRFLSPPAAPLVLATLLHALGPEAGIHWATATVLESASTHEKAGIDELLAQTQGLLNFSSTPQEVFPFQRAFNVRAAPGKPRAVMEHVRALLGDATPDLHVEVLEAGIFHGLGLSLTVHFGHNVEPENLIERWTRHPSIVLADDPDTLGPVDAANQDEILIGHVVVEEGDPQTARVWTVADNLTVGSSGNVLRILEALQSSVN